MFEQASTQDVFYAVAGLAGLALSAGSFLVGLWAGIRIARDADAEQDSACGPGRNPLPDVRPRPQAVRVERTLDPEYDPRKRIAYGAHGPVISKRLAQLRRAPIITEANEGRER